MRLRSVGVAVVVGLVAACGGGSGGGPSDPEAAALVYAVEGQGAFLGGLRGDLGWEVADSYITEDRACAAVILATPDGLGAHMFLANTAHYSISEVYESDPGNFAAGDPWLRGRTWVPTPATFGPTADITADDYRDGRLVLGDRCELLAGD